jgi:fatty-acyl-CoA synthase
VDNRIECFGMNLGHLLTHTARRFPHRPALIQRDVCLTWSALDRRVNAAVESLRRLGIGKGDRILLHARNSPTYFEIPWVAFKLGAIWVPTNFRLVPGEVAHIAKASHAKVMIYDPEFEDHVKAAQHEHSGLALHFSTGESINGSPSYHELVGNLEATATTRETDVDPTDPLWFFYTSGTTGRPKAAMLTHAQMAFVVTNHLADLMPGTTEQDRSLVIAPLSHGAGVHAIAQVARGACSVLPTSHRLDAEEVWRLVEEHKVSNLFAVPTILKQLVEHSAVDRYDHSSLRHLVYSGAPISREAQRRALSKLGKVLVQYYGLGEVTGNITVLPAHLHDLGDEAMPVGSCGFARTGMQIGILAEDGSPLPDGQIGEICVRGAAVFAGYCEEETANRAAFRHGWFHTGDIGRLDQHGFLYIVGRSSDMYISGGSNVYPREVEDVLLQNPMISEAAVLGIPDDKWGEVGIAIIVARKSGELDESTVLKQLDGKLARYKWPRRVLFWESLPVSGYGKVSKLTIRERLARDGEL